MFWLMKYTYVNLDEEGNPKGDVHVCYSAIPGTEVPLPPSFQRPTQVLSFDGELINPLHWGVQTLEAMYALLKNDGTMFEGAMLGAE